MAIRIKPTDLTDFEVAKCYVKKAQNAAASGHHFDLTFAQFKKIIRTDYCPVFGVQMLKTMGESCGSDFGEITIDRLDNTKGYTAENSIAICWKANTAKGLFEGNKLFNFSDAREIFRWVEAEFNKRGAA